MQTQKLDARSARFATTVTALAATMLLSSTAAFAQCVEFKKPEDLFARSDAVFVGTVVANEPTGAQGSHVIVGIATVRVEKSWKGRLDREARVGSDVAFDVGKKYLVFAGGKPLSTTILCRATELVERAKSKLDWLTATQK